MDLLLDYKLIGIGEFSHGILESWIFRFNFLKYCFQNTNQKIFIFIEMSVWQAQNIMNNTIWSNELKKYVLYDGIKIEQPVKSKEGFVFGRLWQYCSHSLESKMFLDIIKYIRKNKNRITLIGIDNDKLNRDYDMYKIIMKHMNPNNINLFWAHNHHINDQLLSNDNYKYIENKQHKWFCGHYLKKKLKDDYCIILSQAYCGENRFNGYCIGPDCNTRTWQLQYIFETFIYSKLKKYVKKNKKFQLLTEFDSPLINFSNSYYEKNKYGVQSYDITNNWNFILFFNEVNKLE